MAGKKVAQYTVGIDFDVNTSGLQQSLQAFKNMDIADFSKQLGIQKITDDVSQLFNKMTKEASVVENAMIKAFNPKLNTYSLEIFEKNLSGIDGGLKTIIQDFSRISETRAVLADIGKQLTTTTLQLKQSHPLLEKMGQTLANTIRWQVATKAITTVTGAIQSAYYFTKDLDKSLNDIRIVTDKSADSMDKFAIKAATAAKELGKSTTDYTNAALIYYQQGLADEEVAKRTETTLKAANVTGQAASAVSEQLTAVWNGYQIAIENTESSIDKLAAVAAHSASDLEEISTAMSKVASAANMTGVDIDQLTAQIATIISVTRQAPESVGTALKTIYARMSDLKLGETDEEGVSLGDVSGTLDSLGIHILDATGDLRDMGTVIEEIAEKWNTLNTAQQSALAESLGGKRQYTNLVALFDNWDKYIENLKTSQDSLGTLQRQQDTYMDSTRAHLQQLETAKEELYNSIMDDDTIKNGADMLRSMVESVTEIVQTLGGGEGVFKLILSILSLAVSKPLASSISTSINNLSATFGQRSTLRDMQQSATNFAAKAREAGDNDLANYTERRYNIQSNFAKGFISEDQMKNQLESADRLMQAQLKLQQIDQSYANTLAKVNGLLGSQNIDLNNKNETIGKINTYIGSLKDTATALGTAKGNYQEFYQILSQLQAGTTTLAAEEEKLKALNLEEANSFIEKQKAAENEKVSKEEIVQVIEKQKEALIKEKAAKLAEFDETSKVQQALAQENKLRAENAQRMAAQTKASWEFIKAKRAENGETSLSTEINNAISSAQSDYDSASEEVRKATEQANYYSDAEIKKRRNALSRSLGGQIGQLTKQQNQATDVIVANEEQALRNLTNTRQQAGEAIDEYTQKIEKNNKAQTEASELTREVGELESRLRAEQTIQSEQYQQDLEKERIKRQQVVQGVTGAITSFTSLAMSISNFSEVIGNAAAEEMSFGKTLKSLLPVIPMLIYGFTGLAHALQALGLSNPIITAITVGLGLVTALITKASVAEKKAEAQRQKMIEKNQKLAETARKNIDLAQQEKEKIDELAKSYSELSTSYDEQELSLAQLQQKTYELLKSYDMEAEAIQALTADKEQLNAIMERSIQLKNDEVIATYEQNKANAALIYTNLQSDEKYAVDKGYRQLYLQSYDVDAAGNLVKNIELDTNSATRTTVERIDKELQQQGITSIINEVGQPGQYNVDLSRLSKEEAIKAYDIIQKQLNYLAVNNIESYGVLASHIGEWLEKMQPIVEQEKKDTDDVKAAQISNKILDIVGYGWSEFDNSNIQEITKGIEDAYQETYDYTEKELEDAIYQAFKEGGHAIDYERYILSNAGDIVSQALAEVGGIDATNEDVHKIYSAYKQYGEEFLQDALAAVPSLYNTLDSLSNDFAKNEEFSEDSLNQLFNSQDFVQWLKDNTDITIDEIKQAGALVRDSYINDYLMQFVGADTEDIKADLEDRLEKTQDTMSSIASRLKEQAKAKFSYMMDSEAREAAIQDYTDELIEEDEEYQKAQKLASDLSGKIASLNKEYVKSADILKISKKRFEDYSKELDNVQSAYSTLTDVVETYNESGYITVDQMQSLMSMDSKYLNALFNEEGQLELNAEALERLATAYINNMRASILQQGQARADLIIKHELDNETLNVFESTTLLNEAINNGVENFDEAAAAIQNYTKSLIAQHGVQDEYTMQLLKENEEYTKNQLRATEYINTQGILTFDVKNNVADTNELLEEELDIYHDINLELSLVERTQGRLLKQREKLVGQDLLNSYQTELNILDKQNEKLEEKLALQRQDAEDKRAQLSAAGVAFDQNGEVANYNSVLQQWANQVRANPEDEVLKANYDKMKNLLSEYETLWDEQIPETIDAITDNATAKIEAQINKFNFNMNVTLDLEDFNRSWNEFERDYIKKLQESDYTGQIKVISDNIQLSYEALAEAAPHLAQINLEIEKMRNGATSSIYGDNQAAALEDLKKYLGDVQDLMKTISSDLTSANEQYANSVKDLADAFEKQANNLERLTKNYDNQIKLVQLMLGEKNAAQYVADAYYEQAQVMNREANKYNEQATYWQNMIDELNAKLADPNLQAETRQNLEDMLDEATERMVSANESAAAAYVSSIEAAQKAAQQNINAQVRDLVQTVLGSSDLDVFKSNWEVTKSLSDEYYDNINRAYQTSQLQMKYQKEINKLTGEQQAKMRNAMKEQMDYLESQDKLSKEDVARAQKKYDLAVAQIALEEAQLNKNTLRLSRDSQGNYTYQYMADTSAIEDAQSRVDQISNEIYNLDLENWKNNLEAILSESEQVAQELYNIAIQIQQIGENTDLSEEERENLMNVAEDTQSKLYERLNVLFKKRSKYNLNAEESTISELYKIATSDEARLLIGGVDYEANRVELERLANTDILTMELALLNDKARNQDIYDNDYKLKQSGLRDWIATDILEANFHNWQETNENIDTSNGELIVKLEDRDVEYKDLVEENQKAIRDFNNKTTKLIQDNSEKAITAYDNVDIKVQELVDTHDALVEDLEAVATQAGNALIALDNLAGKYDKINNSASKAATEARDLANALNIANRAAAGEDVSAEVGDVPGNGGLDTGNDDIKENLADKHKAAGDALKSSTSFVTGSKYTADTAKIQDTTKATDLLSISPNVTKGGQSIAEEMMKKQLYSFNNYLLDKDNNIAGTNKKEYYKNDLKRYSYIANTLKPIVTDNGKGFTLYHLIIKNQDAQTIFNGRVKGETLYNLWNYRGGINNKSVEKLIPYLDMIMGKEGQFKSGGYTGNWINGDKEGRLALLHSKELVLNSEDTRNLLDTIKLNREMMQMQLAAIAMTSNTPSEMTTNHQLDQNVHMDISFPNVTSHTEIETALTNLVNYAAQQANIN